ncbi:MAG: hypothetical protein RQ714_08670 [Nitrosomonas sp.]|nr:hypothetical protein [Nitrosomonas sp.]
MESINISQINSLSKQLEQLDAEIASLCQAGNLGQAKSKTDLYAQQMLADPTIQLLLTCDRTLSELMPGTVTRHMEFLQSNQQAEHTGHDVCDGVRQDYRKPRQWTVWP